jgi:hypothetical protein
MNQSDQTSGNRIPPHDLQAEEAVLGAITRGSCAKKKCCGG